ncbi:MAG TPA: trehalase family glycosidase [Chloroflexota bacterium]
MSVAADRSRLMQGARAVLQANDLGHSTKPAPHLYPHQWFWDSCFIAIGISHYDTARAAEELRSIFKGQWRNGLIPHIIFNPHGTGYFPGPDTWQTWRSPDAPQDVQTSGITDPPVLATSALAVWQNAHEKETAAAFLREAYPGIVRYHEFLYRERDPDGSGLAVVVHPWESGLDNSPPYLDAGKRVHLTYIPTYTRLDTNQVSAANRPTDKDYHLFVYLLEQMRAVDWDQRRYLETAPLQVQDMIFNAILCRANIDLAQIATIIGEDPAQANRWHETTMRAINDTLWDEAEGCYFSRDRVAGELLKDDTVATFIPLFGQVAPRDRVERIIQRLLDPKRYWPQGGYPVPSTALDSPWFNPENYWLGPTWVNVDWMILQGLRLSGRADLADQLRGTVLDLVASAGYREYFNPLTGEGYGTDSFGWTAALVIDLLAADAR